MSLKAQDVSFAYPGHTPVLDRVSLTVERGERVALCARSGRGKTTLCRVLAGYSMPQAGAVLVDDAPLPRRGARPVQLIWQHPEQAFDPLVRMRRSLVEGVPQAVRASRGGAARLAHVRKCGLLERFGIREPWLERFPHELSGGELMRFCIVRALLAEPRYLLCDEMTAMLDAVTQAELWGELIKIAEARGMGLLLVSHSPALVERVATRIVNL